MTLLLLTQPSADVQYCAMVMCARGRTGAGANKWLEVGGFKDVKIPAILVSLQYFIFRAR